MLSCACMACMWLWIYWTSMHCVCKMNTASHWGLVHVWYQALKESSLRVLAKAQEQMFMVFITLHVSSWYLSVYVYVSVYCVAPSSGAYTPACQKKKQENEIKCMYLACLYVHSEYISIVSIWHCWQPLKWHCAVRANVI